MAAAGHGHILGVTSGSGWRAADAGAYSCAKRAVASLTWQLGRQAPPGVTVNAMSPIAATRMVAAALERARQAGKARGGGGLSLRSMPGPEDLGPLGAYLVGDGFGWCTRPGALRRRLGGGGHRRAPAPRGGAQRRRGLAGPGARGRHPPRLRHGRGQPGERRRQQPPVRADLRRAGPAPSSRRRTVRSCAVVTDRPRLAASLTAALEARSVTCHRVEVAHGFADAADALSAVVEARRADRRRRRRARRSCSRRPPRRMVGSGCSPSTTGSSSDIHADAGWARAAADYAAGAARPVRLVTLTDATTDGRSQPGPGLGAAGRVAARPTEGRVTAFAVEHRGVGGGGRPTGRRARRPPARPPRGHGARRCRAGGRRAAGSAFAATPDRSAASPTAAPPSPSGSTPRSGRSSAPPTHRPRGPDDRPAHPRRRRPRAPVGPGPHRLVPVPVAPSAGRRRRRVEDVPPLRRRHLPGRGGPVERREVRQRRRRHRSSLHRRDHRARSATPMPAAVPTPSSAVSRRPTRWPRPSSSSTGR